MMGLWSTIGRSKFLDQILQLPFSPFTYFAELEADQSFRPKCSRMSQHSKRHVVDFKTQFHLFAELKIYRLT